MAEADAGDVRARVVQERERRGYFSGRAAATAAANKGARISFTTWNDWESGARQLGDAMRSAVMVLFDWPSDWPENPPPVEWSPDVSLLRGEVARLAQVVDLLTDEARDRLGVESEFAARLAALEAARDRRPSP